LLLLRPSFQRHFVFNFSNRTILLSKRKVRLITPHLSRPVDWNTEVIGFVVGNLVGNLGYNLGCHYRHPGTLIFTLGHFMAPFTTVLARWAIGAFKPCVSCFLTVKALHCNCPCWMVNSISVSIFIKALK
jgi:hypothetical protein